MRQLLFLTYLILETSISFGQNHIEKLTTNWPDDYKWKIVANKNDTANHNEYIQIIPGNESLTKWTILGNSSVIRNFVAPNLDKVIESFSSAATTESSKAKFTILEKNDKLKGFWAIYKVETSDFPNDPIPESQLTYVKQGETSLFVTFVAIKEPTLSKEFVEKWTKILKSSNLSY